MKRRLGVWWRLAIVLTIVWEIGGTLFFYILGYNDMLAYADARVMRIYGGTTEIMKEIIAKDLGL